MIDIRKMIIDTVSDAITELDIKCEIEKIIDEYEFSDMIYEALCDNQTIHNMIEEAVDQVVDCYI